MAEAVSTPGVDVERLVSSSVSGRDHELAALAHAYTAAQVGQPKVVIIDAEPGMGKTALLKAFRQTLNDPAAVSVHCDPFEQTIDLNVVELLLPEGAALPTSSVEAGRALLAWLGQLQQHGQPVLLLIDDAQWIDLASVEALKFALRRLSADRVLVVLARRPPTGVDLWASLVADHDRTLLLPLAALTEPHVLEMARNLRGWDLSHTAAARLVRHTAGVPLLLHALLCEAPAQAVLSSRADLPVPASVGALVERALANLPSDGHLLLNALAVLNEPTDRLLLGSVPGVVDGAAAVCAALATRTVASDRASDLLTFHHTLFRDAVYDRIHMPQRQQLHQWAAAHTVGYRSLAHRVAAATRTEAGLCAELVAAARAARDAAMPTLAAAHTLLARRMASKPDDRDALLFAALHDFLAAGDLLAAEELRPAAERARPSPERSFALGALAHHDGRVREAETLLTGALTLATSTGDDHLKARASLELGMLYAALNDGPNVLKAAQDARAALPVAPSEADLPRLAQTTALEAVGLWEVGRSTEALELLSEIRPHREGSRWEPDLYATRGMIRYWAGSASAALEDLDHAIELPEHWGSVLMRDRVHVQRSLTRFMLGQWDAASIDATKACVLADSGERPWMVPLAHAVAALVPAMRGEWDVAADHLRRARDGQRRVSSAQAAGMIANSAWHLAAAQEDYERARLVLSAVRATGPLDQLMAVHSYRWVYIGLCHAAIRLGDLAEATEILREYTSLVDAQPQAPASARLAWLRGQLAEAYGDAASAQLAYEEQLAASSHDTPYSTAEVLHASARLLRSRGRRREAVERLTRARAILLQLRARPLQVKVDAELAACGLPTSAAHPLGLTEREQDVAALVAKGMTNKEIASELYLTTKTVEYHLGNTFAKLGLVNRRELRRMMTG